MARDYKGDTWARLFRSSFTGTNSDIEGIYTTQHIGGDYMRPSTPAQVKASLNLGVGDVSGLQNDLNGKLSTSGKAADADKLDGRNSTGYLRTDGANGASGVQAFNAGIDVGSVHLDDNGDVNLDVVTPSGVSSIGMRNSSWNHYDTQATSGHYFYGNINATGNVTAYSDIRVKTNLEVITTALARVNKLTGYTFDRTDIETDRQTGLIAQDVLEVLPEAVTQDPETGHYHVAYGNIVGLLVESIKELKKEVDTLKDKQGV
jgi:hypothetical protein